MTVVPNPPYFSLFFRFKIQLKGHYFDTIEAIKAKLTPRMHLKTGRSAGNSAYVWKGATSRVMVASRHKVSF
jgi:hypothetical protein